MTAGPKLSLVTAIAAYTVYALLILVGYVHEGLSCWLRRGGRSRRRGQNGLAPLSTSWEDFYARHILRRVHDILGRPVASPPGAHITLVGPGGMGRAKSDAWGKGYPRRCLNLGSYNYLGFADDWHKHCEAEVLQGLDNFETSLTSARADMGSTTLHRELEQTVAAFVGKEDAMVFNMGYGTNATTVPALMGKGSLIVSDSLNHASIVNGARASGACIKIFNHNDASNLEAVLREALVERQPRTHKPWTKILVMIEGVYSMEGELCDLPAIVRVCKQYKAYIYLDEAHSIGAVGRTGRGVCEHWGVPTSEIDIMMGTFTKAFGAMGGYIAASKELITYLRQNCAGSVYSTAMSPLLCAQVLSAFRHLAQPEGLARIRRLHDNSSYFRLRLQRMGADVLGEDGSPVVPMLLYHPAKCAAFSREALDAGLAVVVVGFPATPLLLVRCRFCISASHTREDLDDALVKIEAIVDKLSLRYRSNLLKASM